MDAWRKISADHRTVNELLATATRQSFGEKLSTAAPWLTKTRALNRVPL
jgi:hypothetical protein